MGNLQYRIKPKSAPEISGEIRVAAPAKTTAASPSGKMAEALQSIREVEAEKLEPKSPLKKKRKNVSVRLHPEVEDAFKENGVAISETANALLLEYALRKGWL